MCGEVLTVQTEIAAAGHKFDKGNVTKEATCTEKGIKTYICTICKETKTEDIAAKGHDWNSDYTIDKAATETSTGIKSIHCKYCDATKNVTEIPMMEKVTDAPAVPATPATPDAPAVPTTPTTPAISAAPATPTPSKIETTLKVGDRIEDEKTKAVYEVTSINESTVTYIGTTAVKGSNIVIPAEVTLKDGKTYKVTVIGRNAFKNNKTIKSITIGKNIELIDTNAFYCCVNLRKVTFKSDKLKEIGKGVFTDCKKLKKIALGKNLKKIGQNAFKNCKSLKTIEIKTAKAKNLKISKGAFKGLNNKCTIKVPEKQLTKYKKQLKKAGLSSKVKIKG